MLTESHWCGNHIAPCLVYAFSVEMTGQMMTALPGLWFACQIGQVHTQCVYDVQNLFFYYKIYILQIHKMDCKDVDREKASYEVRKVYRNECTLKWPCCLLTWKAKKNISHFSNAQICWAIFKSSLRSVKGLYLGWKFCCYLATLATLVCLKLLKTSC